MATNAFGENRDPSAAPRTATAVSPIDVLGLGCTAVDDLLYVSDYPAEDSKIPVGRHCRQCGGLTATALVAAARMGAACAYAGCLGADDLSQFVERQLADQRVRLQYIHRQANARPVHSTIVVNERRGSRTILFNISGEGGAAADWPSEQVICAAKVLFVDAFGLEGMIRAASIAESANIPVVGDFESISGDDRFTDLLELVNHLIVPLEWAKQRTSCSNPAEVVETLWSDKRQAVVVTAGAEGCWYRDDGCSHGVCHQPAYRVDVVDTTGCGDVFHGTYAAGLAEGLPLPDRIRLASAAAALKARRPGGQAGIPTRNEVDAFLRKK